MVSKIKHKLISHLAGCVSDQEVELLVPDWSFVAASVASGMISPAAHHLRPQAQAAVGVALPGETPHGQIASLHKIHLSRQPCHARSQSTACLKHYVPETC